MADVTAPRTGRSQSSSRGVTITASRKAKPRNAPFKFLRKDEGRLSYTCQPESPLTGSNNHNNSNISNNKESPSMERRGSRSLREAIANDMRKGKNQDPFETVVIAVPKRAPPPNPAAREEPHPTLDAVQLSQRRPPSSLQTTKRPDWVDPDIPEKNGELVATAKPTPAQQSQPPPPPQQQQQQQQLRNSDDAERPAEPIGQRFSSSRSHGTPRRDDDFDDMEWQQRRRRADDLENSVSRRLAPRRYADPGELEDEYQRSGRNFFRRPPRQEYRPSREEDGLVDQLEDELRAAKEERGRYHQLRQQLERERQRFEDYRNGVEQEIDDERAELDAARASDQWQARRDAKVVEERYKSTLELLKTERESNKKLTQENELLRQQLEDMTTRMRETQKLQKAETGRLRREIVSLTRRNEELLEMTREQQIAALESSSKMQPSAPSLQIGSSARVQQPSSAPSTRHSSAEAYEYPDDLRPVGGVAEKQRADAAEERERKRAEAAEERERKRAEAEERRRAEAAEKERKRAEAEERRRAEAAEKEERRRLEEEERERKRKEREDASRRQSEEQKQQQQRRQQQQHEEETDGKMQEPRSQRRAAGHPVLTPRAQHSKITVTTSQRRVSPSTSSTAVSRKPQRTPTAAELLVDQDPTPAEDFPNDAVVSQTALGENPNKREVLYRSGKREIHYANGTRKVILPSGHVVLYFTNGDIKRTFPSGKSSYWYAAAQTTHIQYADGVQVFQFHTTGQIERHLPDGKKEILYPDGIYKVVFADGREETIFPDEL
ncbi:centromere protein J [Trypanosoma grayi]|uniref:centromere protein J n=1 Tax=Trypanosoma grayi TaxID=71804 RepID=UPI0004F45CF5|nr:centromere protein J [Trypanosoma grayi]KEG15014.1 centromere protein J [Trypanosoma grayi]